jgi:hypothetical protein
MKVKATMDGFVNFFDGKGATPVKKGAVIELPSRYRLDKKPSRWLIPVEQPKPPAPPVK